MCPQTTQTQQAGPRTPSCHHDVRKLHLDREREERRRRIITRRKQEKIQQTNQREDRELAAVAAAQRVLRDEKAEKATVAQSRIEARAQARRKSAAADRHKRKADMLYRGWLPWIERVQKARLHAVKALRHHQYCLVQKIWSRWLLCSRRMQTARHHVQARKVRTRLN